MTTVISILLYFLAAFMAMLVGHGAYDKSEDATRFGLSLFVILFVAAACLQVFA